MTQIVRLVAIATGKIIVAVALSALPLFIMGTTATEKNKAAWEYAIASAHNTELLWEETLKNAQNTKLLWHDILEKKQDKP